MHPEIKKLTQKKHALSNTDRKSKATTKPWFSRLLRHPVGLFWDKHTHVYLLTYLLNKQVKEQFKELLGATGYNKSSKIHSFMNHEIPTQ